MTGPATPWADDPVAQSTAWGPLVNGGANFRTRNLVAVDGSRMEFPASLGMRLFAGLFLVVGIGVGVGGIAGGGWFLLLFGAVFASVGGGLLWFATAPVVFDKRQGAFWRGRTAPAETYHRSSLKHYAPLADIHALQILKEHVRGDKNSYDSFELNLVLTDGRRLNVTDHGDYDTLRRNAEVLRAFLERPLWDTVAGR